MDAEHQPRALPEIIAPPGFDGLLPPTASAFDTVDRIVLERPGGDGAAVVLAARRRHLAAGEGWLELDLPRDGRDGPAITATRMSTVTGGEPAEQISVSVAGRVEHDADHWSLDLDHDGLVHRSTARGDGAPPARIDGLAAVHDAHRVVQLRVVDRRGLVVSFETGIPPTGW